MLTRLRVRNFKNLESLDIELGQTVVFIGPNNSGKTTALQALALWRSGLDAVSAQTGASWPGAPINRLTLTHTPVSDARHLWHGLDAESEAGLSIWVEGLGPIGAWTIGLDFHFSNRESIYCWPAIVPRNFRIPSSPPHEDQALASKIAFLPPMSGIAAEEPELAAGRIDVLIGEGQTAQILRNLCLRVLEHDPFAWNTICVRMHSMFGITLMPPLRSPTRGSITLTYEQRGHTFDIANAGRGLQQTLLLLAHLHANPGSTLLLDEPDAHLEILRQRQIYNVLTECAAETSSQIIAASHSEVILNEAAARDVVIAFVGQPHRINRGSQVLKALKDIGFDHYYQADLKGAVIYLEGATDLAILRALAIKLDHPVAAFLEQPFVHYVANEATAVLHHFHGLREARPDLVGFALFDRLDRGLPPSFALPVHCWRKYEIENYIANRAVLRRFAETTGQGAAMEQALDSVETAMRTFGSEAWSDDVKMSEQVLPAVFRNFAENLGLRNVVTKTDFHMLVAYLDPSEIDPEIVEVLDRLHATLQQARPA